MLFPGRAGLHSWQHYVLFAEGASGFTSFGWGAQAKQLLLLCVLQVLHFGEYLLATLTFSKCAFTAMTEPMWLQLCCFYQVTAVWAVSQHFAPVLDVILNDSRLFEVCVCFLAVGADVDDGKLAISSSYDRNGLPFE